MSSQEIYWGLSFGHHDAAIAVVSDAELKYASHSERYSRAKNDRDLNVEQLQEALCFGVPKKIFYYENPTKKKLRYLRSGEWSKLNESPTTQFRKLIHQIDPDLSRIPFILGDHHLSHAASGFYCSSFDDAIVVVCDAIGESQTLTVRHAIDGVLEERPVYSLTYPNSVGLFYSAMTKAMGLKPNEEEYILMGMAAYGNPAIYKSRLLEKLEIRNLKWKSKINFHLGTDVSPSDEADRMNWAAATQSITEDYILNLFKVLRTKFSSIHNWVFCGGVALNCVLNSKIAEQLGPQDNLFIFPNPGDAGSSVGSVLTELKTKLKYENSFWGTDMGHSFSNETIIRRLANSEIVGVARGRAEFGPRALGNRSLLADPRSLEMKLKVNRVKHRQEFRPFGASVIEEFAEQYFNLPGSIKKSQYMQFTAKVKRPDLFPAICHVDGTSRIQTVSKKENPDFYELLRRWHSESGCPMLLNTSLNIRGEPLVNDSTHAEAFSTKYQVKVYS